MSLERVGYGSLDAVPDLPVEPVALPEVERTRKELTDTGRLVGPISEADYRATMRKWRAEANLPPLPEYEDPIEVILVDNTQSMLPAEPNVEGIIGQQAQTEPLEPVAA